MARFISLTLATLLSMAVFAQAAPTGSTDVTSGQVPQEGQSIGDASIGASDIPNKRDTGAPEQKQPATTADTATGNHQSEKRTTTGKGAGVDEDTNQPEKRDSEENDLEGGNKNKVTGQNDKRNEQQDNSSNVPSEKTSISKRCNKDDAATQGQTHVNDGEQGAVTGEQGAATGEQGAPGNLGGITKRNDQDVKNDGSVEGTAGHSQGKTVEKRHKGKNNGQSKQAKNGAQAQGNQQPGQSGQQAAQ